MPIDITFLLVVLLPFLVIEWLFIFIEAYVHFPKMERDMRIRNAVVDATSVTLVLIAIFYLFMYVLETSVL